MIFTILPRPRNISIDPLQREAGEDNTFTEFNFPVALAAFDAFVETGASNTTRRSRAWSRIAKRCRLSTTSLLSTGSICARRV